MSVSTQLLALAGKWRGTNRLWLNPNESVRESESVLEIAPAAMGKFAALRYTWADEGQAQEGLLIVGSAGKASEAQAVWMDSWHMQDKFMVCAGSMAADGGFAVRGTYAAPPGPDWGWRIAVEPQGADTLRLTMYNVAPEGQEFLAVETSYERKS